MYRYTCTSSVCCKVKAFVLLMVYFAIIFGLSHFAWIGLIKFTFLLLLLSLSHYWVLFFKTNYTTWTLLVSPSVGSGIRRAP